jgi:hypothetical protein
MRWCSRPHSRRPGRRSAWSSRSRPRPRQQHGRQPARHGCPPPTSPSCRWSPSTRPARWTSTRRRPSSPARAAAGGFTTRSPTSQRSSRPGTRSTPRLTAGSRPPTPPTGRCCCARRCSATARPRARLSGCGRGCRAGPPYVGDDFEAVVVDERREGVELALADPAVIARADGAAALGTWVCARLTVADVGQRLVRFRVAGPAPSAAT